MISSLYDPRESTFHELLWVLYPLAILANVTAKNRSALFSLCVAPNLYPDFPDDN
ncbi:hypothetical protein [Moorena sp. SIO3H5]|uniref:hypothetical protein n=1 Tax=Moorena sp. SIO3H5 TaxID=2607834 RepID=UPI0025DDE3C2|nr:hypothetical protein [Moorena sp. SIO3H5]